MATATKKKNTTVKIVEEKKPKVEITVDNTEEEILSFEKEDREITFDPDVEKFKLLPEKVIRELGYYNARNYWISYSIYLEGKKEQSGQKVIASPELRVVSQPYNARAAKRFEVRNKDPNKEYHWIRPDEVDESGYLGWMPCTDPNVITFGYKGSGQHVIISPSAPGTIEQLLVEIPKDLYKQNVERPHKESNQKQKEAVDGNLEEDVAKSGGIPFEAKENDGIPWKEERPSRRVDNG